LILKKPLDVEIIGHSTCSLWGSYLAKITAFGFLLITLSLEIITFFW